MLRGPVRRYEATMEKAAEYGLVVPRLFEPGKLMETQALPKEAMMRRNLLTFEAARIRDSKELLDWLEALLMSAIEELKQDLVFIEDLKDILRDSIRAALRSKLFQDHIVEQCREATSSVAVDEIAAHDDLIKQTVKTLIDAELQPALERTLRVAIDSHVADVKRRMGF